MSAARPPEGADSAPLPGGSTAAESANAPRAWGDHLRAALPTAVSAHERHVSLDGRTSLEVRHAAHPDAVRQFDTETLRQACAHPRGRARGRGLARPARHPGQQRRHHPPRRCPRFQRSRLGRRHEHQPQLRVLPRAGGGAAHGRARARRQDRRCRLGVSFQGGIRVASYTSAKSGLAGLTRLLANEWASKGINVNAIAARLLRNQQHDGAAGRPRARRRAPGAHSRRTLGQARAARRRGGVPRLVRFRLRARRHAAG